MWGMFGSSWEDPAVASLSVRLVSFWSMQIQFDLLRGVPCAKEKKKKGKKREARYTQRHTVRARLCSCGATWEIWEQLISV